MSILVFLFIMPANAAPISITNVYELQNISLNTTADYVLANDIDCSDTETWNYNATSGEYEGFEPINRFFGTLHGNGNTISNLYMNRPTETKVGLISQSEGCTLSSFNIYNANITGAQWTGTLIGVGSIISPDTIYSINVSSSTVTCLGPQSGVIFGFISNGDIIDCHSTGNTISSAGQNEIGGIAGYMIFTNVYSCSSDADISGNNQLGGITGRANHIEIHDSQTSGNIIGGENLGGLIGLCEDTAIASADYVTIKDSSSSCDIDGNYNIGGLCGATVGVLDFDRNLFTGSIQGISYLGGAIGYTHTEGITPSSISKTHSYADIDGYTDVSTWPYSQFIGGLVGNQNTPSLTISNCNTSGDITGCLFTGGLIGYDTTYITITNCESSIKGSGTQWLGGFVGASEQKSNITYSHSEADLTCPIKCGGFVGKSKTGDIAYSYFDGIISGNQEAGGIVGEGYSVNIQNCYADGDFTISSTGQAGGLIGEAISARITNSYSSSRFNKASYYLRGLANIGDTTSSYYDNQITSYHSSGAPGVAYNTLTMKNQSTYTGWDFENIWSLSSEVNDGYPYLQQPIDDDTTSPSVTITSPVDGIVATSSTVTILGTATDDVGVDFVTVNGVLATGTTNWGATISLIEGANIVHVVARDLEGNEGRDFIMVFYYIDDEYIDDEYAAGKCYPVFTGTSQVEIGGTYYIWYQAIPYSKISMESEYLTYSQPDKYGLFYVSVDTEEEGFSEGTYRISASDVTLSIEKEMYNINPLIFSFSLEVLPRDYSTSWYISRNCGGGAGYYVYADTGLKKDFKLTSGSMDTNLIMNRVLDTTLATGITAAVFEVQAGPVGLTAVGSDAHTGVTTMTGSQVHVDFKNADETEKLESALYILTSVVDSNNPLIYKSIDAVTKQIENDFSIDYYESGVATFNGVSIDLFEIGITKDQLIKNTVTSATLLDVGVGGDIIRSAKNRYYPENNYQECLIQRVGRFSVDSKGPLGSLIEETFFNGGLDDELDKTVIFGYDENEKIYGKAVFKDNVYSGDSTTHQIIYDYDDITDSNVLNPFHNEKLNPDAAFEDFFGKSAYFSSGNVSVEETIDDSHGIDLPISVKVGPVKLSLHKGIELGTANNFVIEKQHIYNGQTYVVEEYSYDSHVDDSTYDLAEIFGELLEPVGTVLESAVNLLTVQINSASTVLFSGGSLFVPQAIEGNISITSFETSEPETVTLQMFSTMGLSSSYVTSMSGYDFAVGNITDLQPYNVTLDQEATLILNYDDSEITDEMNISIYKWNDSQNAWLPVDSNINQSANEAETNISSFGTYTIGYDQTSPVIQWSTSVLHLDRISAKAIITDSGSGVNSSAISLYLDEVQQNFTYDIFSGMLTSTMITSVGEHVVKIYSEDTSGNAETLEINVSVIEPIEITDVDINFHGNNSIIFEWEYENGTYPLDYFAVYQNNEILENTTTNNFISSDFIGSNYGIYPVDTQGNLGLGTFVVYRSSQLVPLFFYDGNSSFYPTVGIPVTFNASDSYLIQGTIETNISKYTWIFNDDIVNATSGKIVTHIFESEGLNNITLIIEDEQQNNATLTKVIDVANNTQTSTAPVLSPIGNQTVDVNQVLSLALNATDEDGDGLVYSVSYPTNYTFGDLSGNVFTWTPSASDIGVHYLTFTVSDGNLSDNETISITVNDVSSLNGNGTESDPYRIYTLEQLQDMNNDLDAHYILMSDINASETSTWNNGAGFEPIGNETMPFAGTFDGQNYTISNLYINRPNTMCVGLFGYAEGTYHTDEIFSMRYINLGNVSITGYEYSTQGIERTGGLIGLTYDVGIYKCNVSGHVKSTESYGVGGLAGEMTYGSVIESVTSGNVESIDGSFIGGLVGKMIHVDMVNSSSTMTTIGYDACGGLIGYSEFNNITNSYSNSSVTGSAGSIGGLIGYDLYSTIIRSYTHGPVDGSSAYIGSVGGLIGYKYGANIIESYSTGTVTGTVEIGGLVGDLCNSNLVNSYSTSSVNGTSKTGGLIGSVTNSAITNSYSVGLVAGTSNVGGLVGISSSSTATSSYWDTETSGQSTSYAGTGKTTAEMKTQSTFVNWDFEDTWVMQGYPKLIWEISNEEPVADFTSNVTSGIAPLTVSFADQSANTPSSWSWNFGDGTTSTDQSPVHTYTIPGTYTVSLTAENAGGSNTNTRTDYITVSNINTAPVLSPIGDIVIDEDQTLSLTLLATDHGDGPLTYSVAYTPGTVPFGTLSGNTFTWTPSASDIGVHELTFTVSDGSLSDSETVSITVNNVNDAPLLINFVAPTTDNASVIFENYSLVNVSISALDSQDNITGFIDWNNSLVGWWRLEGNSGTIVEDYSTYQRNGTKYYMSSGINNGTSGWTTEGKFSNAMMFDGLDDRIEVLDNSVYDIPIQNSGKITMEAWVYPLNLTYESGILSKRSNYRMILRSGGELKFQTFGWTGGGTSSKVKVNEWSHIAITYDGEIDQLKFYLNGNNVRTVNSYLPNGGTNSNNLLIGRGHDLAMPTFNGTIDEVRLFNRALTPEEIKASYNAGLYRLEANITGLEDGTYAYKAYAQDVAGNVNQTETRIITIDTTVNIVNAAPVLSPIGNIVIDENQALSLTLSATDDGDGILVYSVSYPSDFAFGTLSGNAFTWTPSASDVGVHELTFTVSDGSLIDSETVSITVDNAETTPVITLASDDFNRDSLGTNWTIIGSGATSGATIVDNTLKLRNTSGAGAIWNAQNFTGNRTLYFNYIDFNTTAGTLAGDSDPFFYMFSTSSSSFGGKYFRVRDYSPLFRLLNGDTLLAPTAGTEPKVSNNDEVIISTNGSYVHAWVNGTYVGYWTTAIDGTYIGFKTFGATDEWGIDNFRVTDEYLPM